jgi:AraC-like DNA-binding protein
MDALSDVLRVVQLTGAIYLRASFTAPWSVIGYADPALCSAYLPPTERVVSFHLVTEGSCWVLLPGDPGTALHVEAGDVIVVPQGETHVVCSAAGLPPESLAPLVEKEILAAPGEMMVISHGGSGALTKMVCGFLAVQDITKNPLLTALPRLFKVGIRAGNGEWLEQAMRFATEQAAAGNAGGATVLAKLSELVFVEAMRRYVEAMPDDQKGWLAGLRDRFVSRALTLIHAQPAYPWSVAGLAAKVGMSRSGFAERFADLVGIPPMHYVAQWRLQIAAQQMKRGERSLAAIAEEVGYESEAAFSRAFKREFGIPPATWRRSSAAPMAIGQ